MVELTTKGMSSIAIRVGASARDGRAGEAEKWMKSEVKLEPELSLPVTRSANESPRDSDQPSLHSRGVCTTTTNLNHIYCLVVDDTNT